MRSTFVVLLLSILLLPLLSQQQQQQTELRLLSVSSSGCNATAADQFASLLGGLAAPSAWLTRESRL